MNQNFGLYLFQKDKKDLHVLKDLMQLLRTTSPSKLVSFSYVEAKTSLIPHLSLWENLQLEIGGATWGEFLKDLGPEFRALVGLVKDPHQLTADASHCDKFIFSLVKGIVSPSQNLLIDVNEDLLSPALLHTFKKAFVEATRSKVVYLASAEASLWLDCAFSLVTRKDYRFEITRLGEEDLKRHWAA